MIKRNITIAGLLLFFFLNSCNQQSEFLKLKGPYLGQNLPGTTPEIFAEGIISFGMHEHHLTISPQGDEIFYVIADKFRLHHIIIHLKQVDGTWQEPQVATFSGKFSDFAPTFSPDGKYLLFCSNRPLPQDTTKTGDFNIWKVKNENGNWQNPEPLPSPVNDESNEYNPSVARSGNLYFQDHDDTGVDIYVSYFNDGEYDPPLKLSDAINSSDVEIGPLVDPDENFLIFSSNRLGGSGSMDFYISYKDENNTWTKAVNMGTSINTGTADAIITISPDKKYFFFTNFTGLNPKILKDKSYQEIITQLGSAKNGEGTIYWISAEILEHK